MELYPSCVTCVMNNLLHVAERVLPDPDDQMMLLREVMERIGPELKTCSSAPVLTGIGYSVLREMSGVEDPFLEVKKEFNELMLGLEDSYQDLVENMEDPLHAALVAAGSANLIDFGAFREIQSERVMQILSHHLENTRLPGETFASFLKLLQKRKELLILCDNCGEIVLDKILIRELKKIIPDLKVICAVRGRPILNDATLEDAEAVGLDKLCHVMSSGSEIPGTIYRECHSSFQEIFLKSPVILAKGVGNFECADFHDERIFFLFIVKCRTLSENLKVPESTLVFQKGRGSLL
ncbi:MAG: DUF89 family protein [Synergistales bacterium]|nr:DUF89 family protein [Synergistales bacterium]